jgi:hypothetical protein
LSRLETLDRDKFDAVLVDLLSAQRLIESDEEPAFDSESQSLPCSSATEAMLDRTAARLLRAWARWLPGLGGSSVPYLLRSFIHCAGMIEVGEIDIEVRLARLPLAVVLKMAGYLDDCPAAPWLGTRAVRFRTDSEVPQWSVRRYQKSLCGVLTYEVLTMSTTSSPGSNYWFELR